jgi:hypothetical protein
MTVPKLDPIMDAIVGLARARAADLRDWLADMTPEEREVYWQNEARKLRADPVYRDYLRQKGRLGENEF